MKSIFVKDLRKGDSIFDETFAVKNYKKLLAKNKKPYISLDLSDATGDIRGKIWSDDFQNCEEVKIGDVVSISGLIQDFNGLSMRITKLNKVNEYEPDDYIIKSDKDLGSLFTEVSDTIKTLDNKYLKELLEQIFKDKEFKENYIKSAAAYTVHHSYSGGLLEHSVEVLHLSKTMALRFPKVNKDILFAGAILHDIGKMFEYTLGTTIGFSKRGKLLGHIYIGAEFVKNKATLINDFPEELLDELMHLIISHHGEIEFGSPVRPMTVEAIILWVSDYASTKVNIAYNSVHSGDRDEYTEYHRHLGTELYRSPYSFDLNEES
ncbi:MAG: HD domain-containing protein [Patescibacteria group bacterium]|nr:HD domain-containing protein [Patescibacteria group bacterium]